MFSGTIESRSHEGGLLVHFEGSSPALNAIMVRADDGVYIGKVDGVLGTTAHALAHVAHIDRSLDMDALGRRERDRSSQTKEKGTRSTRRPKRRSRPIRQPWTTGWSRSKERWPATLTV
jgi:rRNA processing protein Gar1